MSSVVLGLVVFACLLAAALLGMLLRRLLPDTHLGTESRDAIKLATAVIATLSALALGLLIGAAKSAHDNAERELRASVADLVLLDRLLVDYGPETEAARGVVKALVEERLAEDWGGTGEVAPDEEISYADRGVEPVQELLRSLAPATEAQQLVRSRALDVSGKVAEDHWHHMEGAAEGLPTPFLIVLVFWLSLLFATFGLLAPGNPTVVAVLAVCAISVAGAIFLISDMSHPYLGLITVSDAPLEAALKVLGK